MNTRPLMFAALTVLLLTTGCNSGDNHGNSNSVANDVGNGSNSSDSDTRELVDPPVVTGWRVEEKLSDQSIGAVWQGETRLFLTIGDPAMPTVCTYDGREVKPVMTSEGIEFAPIGGVAGCRFVGDKGYIWTERNELIYVDGETAQRLQWNIDRKIRNVFPTPTPDTFLLISDNQWHHRLTSGKLKRLPKDEQHYLHRCFAWGGGLLYASNASHEDSIYYQFKDERLQPLPPPSLPKGLEVELDTPVRHFSRGPILVTALTKADDPAQRRIYTWYDAPEPELIRTREGELPGKAGVGRVSYAADAQGAYISLNDSQNPAISLMYQREGNTAVPMTHPDGWKFRAMWQYGERVAVRYFNPEGFLLVCFAEGSGVVNPTYSEGKPEDFEPNYFNHPWRAGDRWVADFGYQMKRRVYAYLEDTNIRPIALRTAYLAGNQPPIVVDGQVLVWTAGASTETQEYTTQLQRVVNDGAALEPVKGMDGAPFNLPALKKGGAVSYETAGRTYLFYPGIIMPADKKTEEATRLWLITH